MKFIAGLILHMIWDWSKLLQMGDSGKPGSHFDNNLGPLTPAAAKDDRVLARCLTASRTPAMGVLLETESARTQLAPKEQRCGDTDNHQ